MSTTLTMEIEKLKTIQKEDSDFLLPTELSKAEVNMNSCILFGLPKCGKTTALSQLPNCLIIDTENGTSKIEAVVKKVPEGKGPVGKMQWLEKLADKIIEAGKPYDYIAIDTLSEVNDWAEWSGTWRYMHSIQGKKFNKVLDDRGNVKKDKEGNPILLLPEDPNYESVHNIGEGYGYRWSREDTMRVFNKYKNAAKKCIFYVCHVEDKFIGQSEGVNSVAPKQLALTGKLRNILPRGVDAIGYVYNDNGKIMINFTGSEERVGGNRCKHLQGYNSVLDWSKIFI